MIFVFFLRLYTTKILLSQGLWHLIKTTIGHCRALHRAFSQFKMGLPRLTPNILKFSLCYSIVSLQNEESSQLKVVNVPSGLRTFLCLSEVGKWMCLTRFSCFCVFFLMKWNWLKALLSSFILMELWLYMLCAHCSTKGWAEEPGSFWWNSHVLH